ncbi:hypothetical protein OSTOST_08862 [Ostertagia ostertagi]
MYALDLRSWSTATMRLLLVSEEQTRISNSLQKPTSACSMKRRNGALVDTCRNTSTTAS